MRFGASIGPVWPSCDQTSWVAVSMTAALTSLGDQDGCAWRMSAAMPATCGEAIEVPLMEVCLSPVPIAVETIVSPGAATSGLTPGVRVPREVKLEGVSSMSGSTSGNALRRSPP